MMLIVILLHVMVALSSLVYTTYLMFKPSQAKLLTTYGLVGLTILSGTYLDFRLHAALAHACSIGFMYIASVGCGLIVARFRLAHSSLIN